MNNTFTKIFTHKALPYLELRYSNSNAHYKKHFHDTFSLGLNKEGLSIYTNENKKYTLDKNMLSIINPNVVHSCNSCTKKLNVFYMMYLDKTWCAGIQKLINPKIDEFINIPSDLLEDEKMYNNYLNLCEILFSSALFCEKENKLFIFFLDFFSLYLNEELLPCKKNKNFEEILLFLNANYKENISLQDLSDKFNLNIFYIMGISKNYS